MNSSMRLASKKVPGWMTAHLKGNLYVNTIYLNASGMTKLSRASRIPKGRKVYRGVDGLILPECFVIVDEDSARGGVEFAFMSTTTNREVSLSYINFAKGMPILFEFDMGSIDRGASLSSFSQYPNEAEILVPAMSSLEVTGEPCTIETSRGSVTCYPARINCNLKAQTMEQIQVSRLTNLVAQEPYLKEEFQRDFEPVQKALLAHCITGEVGHPMGMADTARRELTEMWRELATHGPLWYNKDGNYVDAMSRAVNFKHDWLAKMARVTFSVDPGSTRPVLFAAVEQQAVEVIKTLLSVEGAAKDVVDRDDTGTTAAQFAAREGYSVALEALVEAGADERLARADGATALGLAVLFNHTEVVRSILQRRGLQLVDTDALGRIIVDDGPGRMSRLEDLMATAFMSPATLADWLWQGVSPSGLEGEIGALLSSPGLAEAVKMRLCHVCAFIDHHSTLLVHDATPALPHAVWQLAAREPHAVFGMYSHVGAAAAEVTPVPRLIEWLHKPTAPHPCQFTLAAKEAVTSVAYSKCGSKVVRAEGTHVVVCDATMGFELH